MLYPVKKLKSERPKGLTDDFYERLLHFRRVCEERAQVYADELGHSLYAGRGKPVVFEFHFGRKFVHLLGTPDPGFWHRYAFAVVELSTGKVYNPNMAKEGKSVGCILDPDHGLTHVTKSGVYSSEVYGEPRPKSRKRKLDWSDAMVT